MKPFSFGHLDPDLSSVRFLQYKCMHPMAFNSTSAAKNSKIPNLLPLKF